MTLQDRRKKQSTRNLIVTLIIGVVSVVFFVLIGPKQPPVENRVPSKTEIQVSAATLGAATPSNAHPTDALDKQQIDIWRSQQKLPADLPDDMVRALNTPSPKLPPEMQQQLNTPPPELPEDLRKQLEGPPPELPPDLQAQLKAPPPELPEDIKRALATPPRVVTLEEVNTPPR